MSLKIEKLTDKDTKYKENESIPEPLPKLPFRALLVACSHSGKTLTIGNMLARKEFGYKRILKENIFLFSPTYELGDPSMHGVELDEEHVFKDFDETAIQEIMQDQKDIIKRYGKTKAPHILLVFDDLIAHMPLSKQSLLVKLFFSARHWKISLILTTQSYKHTPKAVRLNSSHMMIFKCNNKEKTQIGEEQVVDIPVFDAVYEIATKEPYSFLYVDNTKQIRERFYVRFEERIILDEVEEENDGSM
jgi:hypothetical protein